MKIEQYLFEFHEARPRRRRPSDDGETLIQGCPVRLVLVIPPVLGAVDGLQDRKKAKETLLNIC